MNPTVKHGAVSSRVIVACFTALLVGCDGGGATCDATSCASGCCSNGVCVTGDSVDACGSGGQACGQCWSTQVCAEQRCVAPGTTLTSSGGGSGSGGSGGGGGDSSTTSGPKLLHGHVTYDFVPVSWNSVTQLTTLDFAHTVSRPVRRAVVQVMNGQTLLASATTDDQGAWTAQVSVSSGRVQVYALAQTISPPIRVVDNTDSQSTWAVGAEVSLDGNFSGVIDLHAASGWTGADYDAQHRIAAPFAILDSMYTATRAFTDARALTFPPLVVNWSEHNAPQSGDPTTGAIITSHFSHADGQIYVLGKAGVDTDEFDSHVIVHEWGHFFEANLSRSDSPGGRHSLGEVVDPRLAFGEGWGNAVASMVLPETAYADSNWSNGALTGFGFDLESAPSPTDDPTPSGFSEASVMRLLFDVYDPANESFDTVSAGLGPIIDVLTGAEKRTPALTTVASFLAGLKAVGVDSAALDSLSAHSGIGAISSAFGDGDPGLRAMFTAVGVPSTSSVGLGGGFASNSWQQNQYFVFQGTGGAVSADASSTSDVAISVFQDGALLGSSDANTSGTEHVSVMTRAGEPCVVVITGFATAPGDYAVQLVLR